MSTIVPATEAVRAMEPPWFFGCDLPFGGRGSAGLSRSVGTDHVLQSHGETQPTHERVDGVAGQKPPARRVGARLKLQGDAHSRLLIHIGSIAGGALRPRHGGTAVFCRSRGGTAAGGAADRNAPGNWPRELIESFR